MIEQMIIDADICIKLGASEKYRYLETTLPLLAKKIYMHSHAISEVKIGSPKKQLDTLLSNGVITEINETTLSPQDRNIFDMVHRKLANVMIDPQRPKKNLGEVCSLSIAKVMGIPYFLTEESSLQSIVDSQLNTGMNDIKCLRVSDIIGLIRQGQVAGMGRKDAKLIWALAGLAAEYFNTRIWPL